MRGEYLVNDPPPQQTVGSPPHAWGILRRALPAELSGRFTPTCVGNTARLPPEGAAGSVHPHMRGEYSAEHWGGTPRNGSPPHAWGIRLLQRESVYRVRFTPTCVGNTGAVRRRLAETAVHPHMRGEYLSSAALDVR